MSRVTRIRRESITTTAYSVQRSAFRKSTRLGREFYNRSMAIASVRKVADADFPTRWGHFRILGFEGVYADDDPARCGQTAEKEEAVALVHPRARRPRHTKERSSFWAYGRRCISQAGRRSPRRG